MASPQPGLRVDEELPVAPSHSILPITRDSFVLQYGDFDHGLDDKKWDKSVAKLVGAMGSLPVYPQAAAASGRFDGGCHTPVHYAYSDDLASCTWGEGWKVIDDFDWGPPESQQSSDEDVGEERLTTPAVEGSSLEALPSDGRSSVVAHNTSTCFHHVESEPSVDGETLHLEPKPTASIAASLLSPLCSEELAPPALPSTASLTPRKASEEPPESSSPWIESPPSKATTGPGIIIPAAPFEDVHPRSPTALLLSSSTLSGDLVEADSASPHDKAPDKALGVGGIQEAAESIRQVLTQVRIAFSSCI
jgi:hypothetical protein